MSGVVESAGKRGVRETGPRRGRPELLDPVEAARDLGEGGPVPGARELGAVLDGSASLVYVSDPVTHELLYANAPVRERCGSAAGTRCHEAVYGRATPCPFCAGDSAPGPDAGELRLREVVDPERGRRFLATVRAMRWPDGRLVRHGTALDVTGLRPSPGGRADPAGEGRTLRAAGDPFAAFMDNLPGMAFMKHAGGPYTYANGTFERIAGLPRGGAPGRRDEDLWSDELADSLRTGDRLVARRLRPLETLEEFPHSDGAHKWLLTKFPVAGADDSPPVLAGIAVDITSLKRAEDKVRQERDRAQRYLDVAGVAMVAFDVTGAVMLINKKGCELLGRTELNVVGRNWFDCFVPARTTRAAARRFRRFVAAIAAHPRAGRPVESPDSFESLVLTADGRERTVAWHVAATTDARGRVVGVLASGEDVTDRKRAERALRESEQRYRLLAENATDVIWTTDLGGRILYASPSVTRTLGYFPREIVGRPREDILAPAARAAAAGALSRELAREGSDLFDGFRSWTLELEMARKDGSSVWTETSMSFLREPFGAPVGVLLSTRDVTRRKALEEELLRSRKLEAVGRLAGGVAHDFNNLLTAIIGHCELLSRDIRDAAARERVRQIRNAGEMGATLTRMLLAFSRGQAVRTRVVNLGLVIEGLGRLLGPVVGDDIALETKVAPDLGCVRAAPAVLEQVIVNMVVNSKDAMPGGGKLTVEALNVDVDEGAGGPVGVEPGRYVALRVSDTGCGMDEETMSRVFEPFFTTKERGRGTGLGLSTVYGFVRSSGGHIWVESEESKGSTFNIYLRRVDGPAEGFPAPQARRRVARSTEGSETILVAEDNDVVRELVHIVLSEHGYRVLTAADGKAALEAGRRHDGPVDLLLADVVMPGMGGRELFERLAAERPGLRAVFVSGHAEDAVVRGDGLPPGTAFQGKPFGPEALARKVRDVLDAQPGSGVRAAGADPAAQA